MDEEKKKVIRAIRGLLISLPYAATVKQLEHDYYGLMGQRIPFQKFGFRKIEDFLNSEDSLTLSRRNEDIVVTAKITEKSAHVAELVSKQKTDKKLIRKAQRCSISKTFPSSNWRPKYIRQTRQNYHQTPPRLAAVAHNQFINRRGYEQPKVPSKIVVPESSALYSRQSSIIKKPISSRLQINTVSNGDNRDIEPADTTSSQEPCLASTRERIRKKMSEIDLERDSGNSSPTDESAPAEVPREVVIKGPEFVETGDKLTDLKVFAELFKLGPVEITRKSIKTKKNCFDTARIKVGKESYNSYPEEFSTYKAAEEFCAQLALTDLMSKYMKKDACLVAGTGDILERIPPMLEKHNHGMWVSQLELDYADKYKEKLPHDWLKIVDNSPNIQLERCLNSYIIRYCKPGEVVGNMLWPTSFKTLSDVSVPSNTIQAGEGGKIIAQITCVMSTNEIWCRQCSTEESDLYNDMIYKIDTYYNSNKNTLKAESISVGSCYVTLYEKQWYRVKAIEQSDVEIRCLFIDFGDELNIAKDNIYQLKREFAVCQAQAFVCSLVGLEDLYEVSENSDALQNLMYKQVILELAETDIEDNVSPLPVFMYSFDDGKSINEEMISLLTLESAPPLFEKDSITDVYVSNIENNGDIYVQYRSQGYKTLQKLLLELECQLLENPRLDLLSVITKDNSEDKIYLIRDKIDKHFYRIKIIDWAPTGSLAQIYFTDVGKAQVIDVHKETLYPLDQLSDILDQYPFQAYKVKMAIDEVPEDFISITQKLMSLDQMVLMKITNYNNEKVPIAEFFKRNTDGTIFCINKSIMMEIELKNSKKNYAIARNLKKNRINFDDNQNNVPSGGKLPGPDLPTIGNFFELHIPLAVNPYNFFIQPLDSNKLLNDMMEKLQIHYKDLQYSPLQFDQVIPGNIYVSKHEDGLWYRTSVIKVIHPGSISVFLCDFGYYTNLSVHQLFPLELEFTELPYQAVKAKLAGVRPKYSKWTVEDCESFKTLVEGKNFYSQLENIERDELYKSDIVLRLSLIDTSTNDDVFITSVLVNRQIAIDE